MKKSVNLLLTSLLSTTLLSTSAFAGKTPVGQNAPGELPSPSAVRQVTPTQHAEEDVGMGGPQASVLFPEANEDINDLRAQLRDALLQNAANARTSSGLEHNLGAAQSRAAALEEQLEVLMGEKDNLQNRFNALTGEKEDLERAFEGRAAELMQHLNTQVEANRLLFTEKQDLETSLKAQLDALRQESNANAHDRDEKAATVATLTQELASVREEMRGLVSLKQEILTSMEVLQGKNADYVAQLDEALRQTATLREKTQTLAKTNASLTVERDLQAHTNSLLFADRNKTVDSFEEQLAALHGAREVETESFLQQLEALRAEKTKELGLLGKELEARHAALLHSNDTLNRQLLRLNDENVEYRSFAQGIAAHAAHLVSASEETRRREEEAQRTQHAALMQEEDPSGVVEGADRLLLPVEGGQR